MAERGIEEDISLELKVRLLPLLQKHLQETAFDLGLVHLESPQFGGEIWNDLNAGAILNQESFDSKTAEVVVVAGRVGSGRTSLCIFLLWSWLKKANHMIAGISDYKFCLVIEGERLEKGKQLEDLQFLLPDTICHWGRQRLMRWLETERILVLVDNFLLDTGQEKQLKEMVNHWKRSKTIVFTNLEDAKRVVQLVSSKSFLFCQFRSLTLEDNTNVLKHYSRAHSSEICFLNEQLQGYLDNIPELFETVGGTAYFLRSVNENVLEDVPTSTCTDVVWNTTYKTLARIKEKYMLPDKNLVDWLSSLCRISYECLANGSPLLGEEVDPIRERTRELFPELKSDTILLKDVMSSRPALYRASESIWCINHQIQQEIYASWYVLGKCMQGIPMKRLLKKITCEDPFGIYAGGLLQMLVSQEETFFEKFEEDSEKREKKIERVIRNLFVQTERSSQPTSFILRVLHEMHCNPLLTEKFLRESYIPSQLHIFDNAIYRDAILALTEYSPPKKIHFLVRKRHHHKQLLQTLGALKGIMAVELAVALMNHLEWGSDVRSNSILQILSSDCSLKLMDFVGCLDAATISQLHLWESTQHIVCLRVRVCDPQTAITLVNCQDHLRSLMWLEIDFDFPLNQLFDIPFPAIRTPLIDLSFCKVVDADIPKLGDFLHSVSRRFSGVHIHKSCVSPQGTMELIKYFYRRDMFMYADSKTIQKYRKYRFPEMSAVGPGEENNDEITERLLGYNDHHHYADNEVHSSYLVNIQEANILKTFLDIMVSVVCFSYTCKNFMVRKETDGTCFVKESFF